MWDSVRGFGAGLVGIAALLALGHQAAFGQRPAPAANANVYVNPMAAAGRFANTANLGQSLTGPAGGQLGYGSLAPGGYGPSPGYGTLAASYANPNLGYGSLTNNNNNNGYGNGYGGGYGISGYGMYGTQWMMNPYQGYLSGAADVTRANAEYYLTIQQARLMRQDTIRSSIQTRRAFIEEAEWERAHMPDPEKIRQKNLERELDYARHSPRLTDIWTARAPNSLVRYLIEQTGKGARAERDVPLNQDTLDRINFTVGDNRGSVGLLKDGGKLKWPLPLQKSIFKDAREDVIAKLREAQKSIEGGSPPDSSVISDLRIAYNNLKDTLNANIDRLSPDEYFEANRYLRSINNTLTALKDPKVIKYVNGDWKPKARSVSELVRFLRENGLSIGEVTPGNEDAYVALYHALASFDSSLQRGPGASPGSDNER